MQMFLSLVLLTFVTLNQLRPTVSVSSSAILPNDGGTKQAPPASTQDNFNLVDNVQQTKQPTSSGNVNQSKHSGHQSKQRSNTAANDDDLIPLATINNHSRNNQNQLRPPQYVDLSALVPNGGGVSWPKCFPLRPANQRSRCSNLEISSNLPKNHQRNVSSNSFSSAANGGAASNSIPANSLLSPKSRSGLPECATQQVCNAIFVRMNYTQRLCECSSNYNWKCSNTLDPQDGHTIELTRKFDKRVSVVARPASGADHRLQCSQAN